MNPSARLGQSSPRSGFILIRNVKFDSSTLGQCAALIDYSLSIIAAATGRQEAATSRYVLPSKTKPNLQSDGQARVHSQESVTNHQPWLLCAPHLVARLGQLYDTCWTPPQIAPDRASRKSHAQDICMLSWSTALRNPASSWVTHVIVSAMATNYMPLLKSLSRRLCQCPRVPAYADLTWLELFFFSLRRHHDRTSRRVLFCSGWLIERSCPDQVNDQALQVRYEVCKYTY